MTSLLIAFSAGDEIAATATDDHTSIELTIGDDQYVLARDDAAELQAVVGDALTDELRRLYERLPEAFDAEDIGRTGITGSRRHMIVRHVVEHPAFDCEMASRKPLRAEKTDTDAAEEPPEDADERRPELPAD